MTRLRDERGSMSVLVLGLALVTFAIAGVAVDGTRVFLFRRSLQNVSDSVATAAASELDGSRYYRSGGSAVRLDGDSAHAVGSRFAAARNLDAQMSLRVTGGRVVVVMRGEVATTFLGLVGLDAIPVAASSTAVPVPGRPGT